MHQLTVTHQGGDDARQVAFVYFLAHGVSEIIDSVCAEADLARTGAIKVALLSVQRRCKCQCSQC